MSAKLFVMTCVVILAACAKPGPVTSGTSEGENAEETRKCTEVVERVKKGELGPQPRFSESTVRNALKYKLIDPFSAQYEISNPRRGVLGCGITTDPKAYWLAPVLVNAKNKLGAYTGWHQYIFTWKEGKKGHEWDPNWFDFMVTVYSLRRGPGLSSEEAKEKSLQSVVWVD